MLKFSKYIFVLFELFIQTFEIVDFIYFLFDLCVTHLCFEVKKA